MDRLTDTNQFYNQSHAISPMHYSYGADNNFNDFNYSSLFCF